MRYNVLKLVWERELQSSTKGLEMKSRKDSLTLSIREMTDRKNVKQWGLSQQRKRNSPEKTDHSRGPLSGLGG